jgi:hypothetical protein
MHDEGVVIAAERVDRRSAALNARAASADALVLDEVLRRAPIGVVILDRDLRIERASRTAESDGPLTPSDAGRASSGSGPTPAERGRGQHINTC